MKNLAKMADDFFSSFGREIGGQAPDAAAVPQGHNYESSGQWKIWLIVFAALILAMIFAF